MMAALPALALGCAALLAAPAARAGCQLQQMEIPVRIVDHRPIATMTLNGTEVQMLVDSGAFFSMLTHATAEQLKLKLKDLPWGMTIQGYTGKIAAQRTRVDKVGLQGAELSDVEFVVGGNELGAGIQGLLGRNILATADTEYDLAHGLVKLVFPKGDCGDTQLAYWAGDAPVVVLPLKDNKERDLAIRVEVAVNGKSTMALLDTGAPLTSLTLKAARRAGIEDADMALMGRAGGLGEARVSSWMAPVATFEVGGEKITNSLMMVSDTGGDVGALVGLDYFLSHRIYVSRLQRQMYVTWNGGPVFAQQLLGTKGDYDKRFAAAPGALNSADADALARRGAAALAAGNHAGALEDLNRACELAPQVADYLFTRARLHLAMENHRLALADLDQALKLDDKLSDARLRRASLRVAFDDAAGAQADLTELDARLPSSAAGRGTMGRLYAQLGLVPQALRQFELWVSTHPRDADLPGVLNDRCWMRARLGLELPLALQDCQLAVDKDPDAAHFRDSLGWTYLRMGDVEKARKAFDGALKLSPNAFSHYGRGLALLRLNEPQRAAQDLAAARKLSPRIDAEVRKAGFDPAPGGEPAEEPAAGPLAGRNAESSTKPAPPGGS